MARNASNYRQARRAAWRALNKEGVNDFVTWENFNAKAGYGIGTKPSGRADVLVRGRFGELIARLPGRPAAGRSKYMPHIGAKQRAKGAVA